MAVVNFFDCSHGSLAEFGHGAAAGAGSSPPTASATNAYGGTGYSVEIDVGTTATSYVDCGLIGNNGNPSTHNASTLFVNFRFRVETLPASGSEPIFLALDSGPAQKLAVRITSAGELAVYDSTDTLVATGAASISLDVWYDIGVSVTKSATPSAYSVYLDEASYLSGTAAQNNNNIQTVRLGRSTAISSQSYKVRLDNVVVDSAQFNHAVESVLLLPNANGSTMQWTSGTGGSDYTQVDETVLDEADYVMSTGGTGEVALFSFPDAVASGISGTILAIKAMCSWRENASTTSALVVRVRSGGTNSDTGTANNATTTSSVRYRLLTADPATAVAWTASGIDGIEAGAVEGGTAAVRLNQTSVRVLFVPQTSKPWHHYAQLMGAA